MRRGRPAGASCCHCLTLTGTVLVAHFMASCDAGVKTLQQGVCKRGKAESEKLKSKPDRFYPSSTAV